MKERDLVEIEWIDSLHCSGWKTKGHYISEEDESFMIFKTVGYLICETKKVVHLAQSIGNKYKDGDYQTDARMAIPKVAIINKWRIK